MYLCYSHLWIFSGSFYGLVFKTVIVEQLSGDKQFVQPTVLVGRGAEDWAQKHGIELCDPASLISKRSQQQWQEARKIVKGWEKETMDTVGAVSVTISSLRFGHVKYFFTILLFKISFH